VSHLKRLGSTDATADNNKGKKDPPCCTRRLLLIRQPSPFCANCRKISRYARSLSFCFGVRGMLPQSKLSQISQIAKIMDLSAVVRTAFRRSGLADWRTCRTARCVLTLGAIITNWCACVLTTPYIGNLRPSRLPRESSWVHDGCRRPQRSINRPVGTAGPQFASDRHRVRNKNDTTHCY